MLRAPLVSIAVYFRVLISMQGRTISWSMGEQCASHSHSRYVMKAISKLRAFHFSQGRNGITKFPQSGEKQN